VGDASICVCFAKGMKQGQKGLDRKLGVAFVKFVSGSGAIQRKERNCPVGGRSRVSTCVEVDPHTRVEDAEAEQQSWGYFPCKE